ncbi:MAG TPA: rhodanese-like domain-containing protein [Edaphobacter sp.]
MLYGTAVALMVVAVLAVIGWIIWRWRSSQKRKLEQHMIEADALRKLLETEPEVLLLDVRQPLDLLAHSEMIPGAKRIPPKDIRADPSVLPKDKEAIVYCTCEGQKTSREIVEYGLSLGFEKIRLLKGGLDAWKAKGYPVVPYRESFRLDTAV